MTASPQTADGPLVTFALLAYNQERFIREAIEGAFAQSYQPLEIILSDDCSTDRTFEIIKNLARDYRGSHLVKTRRSRTNSGILNHLLDVVHEAEGKLIVLGAGDDISKADRVSELAGRWMSTRALGLCSRYDIIDENGCIVERDCIFEGGHEIISWFRRVTEARIVLGATAAYDRSLFRSIPHSRAPIYNEDVVLSFLIMLRDQRIELVNRSLLLYRKHTAMASTSELEVNWQDLALLEQKRVNNLNTATVEYCEMFAQDSEGSVLHLERLAATKRFSSIRKDMVSGSFWTRLKALSRAREKREARHALLRVFGLQPLILAKIFLRMLPRGGVRK